MDELLDIVDMNGDPTGEVEERRVVHAKGYWHRTSHVWIIRNNEQSGFDILLQKRSSDKDSFPGCYDISSAGHIPTGSNYITSALRELKEELGIDGEEEELEYCMTRKIANRNIFYGKEFIDNQITRVYRMRRDNLQIEQLRIQKEEIDCVIWMDYQTCIQAVKDNTIKHCIALEELLSIVP